MADKPFVVLLAEDSEHDVISTKRAWKRYSIRNPLRIVRDGEECLDYLYRRGKYSGPGLAPSPGLLLLDLKMPRMGGLEVLEHIRSDPRLRRLPIVILTTSREEEDRLESYDLGVNAYIVKPVDFEGFSQAIQDINVFWELVELPDSPDATD